MNTGRTTLLFACVAGAILSVTIPSRAQAVLDQQSGPALTPTSKDAAPSTDVSTGISPPASPMLDPKAVKAVDDAELAKELIDPNGIEKPAVDPKIALKEMVEHMDQSQARLTDKDVGAVTQETQHRIVTNLDTVIEYVRQQQQKQQQKSKPKPSDKPGDKRQESKEPKKPVKQEKPGDNAADASQLTPGAIDTPQTSGDPLRNKGPAEWGYFAPKDRDLISNGVNEQYLPAYKEMIDRYYQALADLGKSKDK